MDDRELLELAAKAEGRDLSLYEWERCGEDGMAFWQFVGDGTHYWNPLISDADAFRLMVRLGMNVYVDTHPDGGQCVEAEAVFLVPHQHRRIILNIDGDVLATTRRAITMAAAGIGKANG